MRTSHKLLFTSISVVLAMAGVSAIVTKSHTTSSRFHGIVTALGEDAVWSGQTFLLLALLPLIVWLPKRVVGMGVATWWLTLMVWLFSPFFLR